MSDAVTIAVVGGAFAAFSAAVQLAGAILLQSMKNKMDRIEMHTNGMHNEIVKLTGESQRAEGKAEGVSEEKARSQT